MVYELVLINKIMRRQIEHSVYQTLQLRELIGRGSYGQIYKAVSLPTNKMYAVKVIPSDADSDALPKIEKQIRILMSTQHQNIVKCHSVEVVEDEVWIIMDFCEAGSLADIMSKKKSGFGERQIRIIMAQILKGLAYLHANKIMHRDIKAANILVNKEGKIKVADFGVSTLLHHTQTGRNTKTGSPFWMSPELLSKSQYSYKTDIWSLGITAIQLAEGAPPYSHQHPYRAIFSIQSHPPSSLSDPSLWSPEFNDFVRQCLTVDVSHRPSAKQLLSHPFFQSLLSTSIDIWEQSIQSDAQSEEEIESPSCGTVILHRSRIASLWEKQKQEPKEDDHSCFEVEEGQQNNFGTVMIDTEQNGCLQALVIQNFRQGDENSHRNSNIKGQGARESLKGGDCEISQVEGLYQKMQQQISQIRNKYFKKIREIEQKNTPTFEQMLKRKKIGVNMKRK